MARIITLLALVCLACGSLSAAAPASASPIVSPVRQATAPATLPTHQLGTLPLPRVEGLAVEATGTAITARAARKLTRAERRADRQEMRQGMKSIRETLRAARTASDDKVLLIILSFLISPVAMYLYEDDWTDRVTLNLILYLLTCTVGGIIHALVIIGGDR